MIIRILIDLIYFFNRFFYYSISKRNTEDLIKRISISPIFYELTQSWSWLSRFRSMIRQFAIILYKYNVIHTIIGRITLHVEVAGWQRDSLWKVNWRKSVSQKCARPIWSDRGIGLWRGREDAVSSSRISRILIAKCNCIVGMQLHELSDNYKSRLRLLISRRLDTYVCVYMCVCKETMSESNIRSSVFFFVLSFSRSHLRMRITPVTKYMIIPFH